MEVKQIYEIVNNSLIETLGKDNLITENLDGIVDAGNEIFNANAFDRFVRLENAGGTEGAGLGLAFVRSAVREKGGRVSAAVKDGVFRLTLAL